MKYIVQGQKITNTYKLISNKNEDGTFLKKPEIRFDNKDTAWGKILDFEMLSSFNHSRINITEDEEVIVKQTIFRADEVITYLRTNKIISTVDNKSEFHVAYKDLLAEYCDYICKKYPKVKRHVEIYNISLPIEEIDEIVKEVEKSTYQMGGLTGSVTINCGSGCASVENIVSTLCGTTSSLSSNMSSYMK